METTFIYDTKIGKVGIIDNGNSITEIYFANNLDTNKVTTKETPLIKEAVRQLNEYFEGKRQDFNLPLDPKGTTFQKDVWKVLETIPYGETWSYKQVAEKVNSPKAYRAVGMANNRNPIAIVIPCHRVIGANGKLVGYGGGLDIKEYLLNMEKKIDK